MLILECFGNHSSEPSRKKFRPCTNLIHLLVWIKELVPPNKIEDVGATSALPVWRHPHNHLYIPTILAFVHLLGTIMEAASYLLMVHEWPINCPKFMKALVFMGLDSASQMRYRRMDHHLLLWLSGGRHK
ncbi:uncharacterized protein LOC110107571 isoform X2 [Dendrobium catenatum]|uniref:uncharacterized protein LOC110107571 isoform X2 n=1 Tax=Dendrobium catenatum TaxID=906689 RepID=UPI0010A00C3D|nr:uncharacterized protein LOC110107571 isoform X2 [Dendrobium catenatum]